MPSRTEPQSIVVVACGGRGYDDAAFVDHTLDGIHDNRGIAKLVTGGASGADLLSERWATRRKVPNVMYGADWKRHGRKAGPMRNQEMLDAEKPDLVVAFPGGKGTADMVRRARAADVPVIEVSPPPKL